MTYQEIAAMVASIDLPFSYYQFDNDTAVAPPFVVFYYPESDDFVADGSNYQDIRRLTIELYTDQKDFALEKRIQDILKSNGLVYEMTESYIDSELLFMITFTTSFILKED